MDNRWIFSLSLRIFAYAAPFIMDGKNLAVSLTLPLLHSFDCHARFDRGSPFDTPLRIRRLSERGKREESSDERAETVSPRAYFCRA